LQGNLNFIQTIQDPVHGPIPLTDLEVDLLKTQCVGKLRWIKQMGLAFFCFPGANHTRFEHSIGAMHVAYLMFDRLSRSENLNADEHQVIAKRIQDFRLAALFHDLGHAPFSHTLEEFFKRYPEYNPKGSKFHSHEYYTKAIIRNNSEFKKIFFDWEQKNRTKLTLTLLLIFPSETMILMELSLADH
jgi:HD superfamily phosphohydrolase